MAYGVVLIEVWVITELTVAVYGMLLISGLDFEHQKLSRSFISFGVMYVPTGGDLA